MASRRLDINLKNILIAGTVTLVVTIISSQILTFLQNRGPVLEYYTSETITYSSKNKVVGIYLIQINNKGKTAIKNVICHIYISKANIEECVLYGDVSLIYFETIIGDSLKLEFPTLNPSESLKVSILATGNESISSKPFISLRGEGVMGIEKKASESIYMSLTMIWMTSFISSVGSLLLFLFIYFYVWPRLEGMRPLTFYRRVSLKR